MQTYSSRRRSGLETALNGCAFEPLAVTSTKRFGRLYGNNRRRRFLLEADGRIDLRQFGFIALADFRPHALQAAVSTDGRIAIIFASCLAASPPTP